MAVVFSRASQQYTPRTFNFTVNVPAKVRKMALSFTREGLPAGDCIQVQVVGPDGTGIDATISGGPSRNAISTVGFGSDANQPDDVPGGTYSVSVSIKQTLTTAVTGEVW